MSQDISDLLSGKYVAAIDVQHGAIVTTIAEVTRQVVGSDVRCTLIFRDGRPKPLVCNKTNLRAIAAAYGTNTAAWVGRQLELYPDVTQFQGKTTPCVRVRIPVQQTQSPAPQPPVSAPDPNAP